MRKSAFLLGAIVAVAGCATVSQMAATGGSRADGIVKLSFEVGMFDRVQIDEAAAQKTAKRRCSVRGYNDAEAFGGVTRQCNQPSGYGCMRWFVTREYQCLSTGGGTIAGAIGPVQAASAPQPIVNANDTPGTIDLGGGREARSGENALRLLHQGTVRVHRDWVGQQAFGH